MRRSTRTTPRAARRVDELVVVERDADMRGARRHGREEHQVAGAQGSARVTGVPTGTARSSGAARRGRAGVKT